MRQIWKQTTVAIVLGTTPVICGTIIGCTAVASRMQPNQLESHIDSNGTAEDHLSAAFLYEQKAERTRAEAGRYEREALAINSIEDPKGFRRNALFTAAKELHQEAADLQRLFVSHQARAQTMTGRQQSQ